MPYFLFVPAAIGFLFLFTRAHCPGVLTPSISTLKEIPQSLRQLLRLPLLGALSVAAVAALGVAAARPQKVSIMREERESRNLILALDISKSMLTADINSSAGLISRITAVKQVVDEFVQAREGDRVGLVVFGSGAFLQSPLTLDHELVSQMVNRLEAGMAGDGTAIGDGLGLSLKRIADIPSGAKAVVLITDGVNNSGQVNPLKAALIAKDLAVKVHTIGIGSDSSAQNGGLFDLLNGQAPRAEYDEATLRKIAESTGGVFFNASDLEGLGKVYREIDALETTKDDQPERRIVDELFPFFSALALGSYLLYLLIAHSIFMKIP